jgi:hypothetical protein
VPTTTISTTSVAPKAPPPTSAPVTDTRELAGRIYSRGPSYTVLTAHSADPDPHFVDEWLRREKEAGGRSSRDYRFRWGAGAATSPSTPGSLVPPGYAGVAGRPSSCRA